MGYGDDEFAYAFARIECHYFINKGFFSEDDYLLSHAEKLQNIPTTIIHGRYDVICPVRTAFELKERLPQAKLVVVPDAGHSMEEEGICRALLEATDSFGV